MDFSITNHQLLSRCRHVETEKNSMMRTIHRKSRSSYYTRVCAHGYYKFKCNKHSKALVMEIGMTSQ